MPRYFTDEHEWIDVEVNGEFVNHAENCSVTRGAIALQSEGTPIEYRNIRLRPLTEAELAEKPTE